ncbi:hypothetical protein ACS0TY_005623 [Phlomoides rotata]
MRNKFFTFPTTIGWSNTHRTTLVIHFKDCAYASTKRIFDEKVAIFKEMGGKIAEEWLTQLSYEKWGVAYSPHITRYSEMTSNTMNNLCMDPGAMAFPITHMIDSILKGISAWFVARQKASEKWTGALCPTKKKS